MSDVERVKEAVDIVDVIGSRVELKKSGINYRGLCPFHSEKSPSFFVSDSIGRYKCFGCGETGDVFNFLEKYEGMTFSESLQYLAKEAGLTLEKFTKSPDDLRQEELLTVLSLAREYYHYLLTGHIVGKKALNYLKERRVGSEAIEKFEIGFALNSWDGLIKYLHHKKKYSLDILLAAGLVIRNPSGRFYDRFRGRIMFPLKNHRGAVVGFSGRLLGESQEAKYINSPETILYHKSKMLFGFSEQFSDLKKHQTAILVEGEFDVISSYQAHLPIALAIKGSAMTQDHAKLLGRAVERVLVSFDSDKSGIEATMRAINIIADTNLELRVINLEGAKDPDELIKKDPRAWRDVTKKSLSAYEFLIRSTINKYDKNDPAGQKKIIKDLSLPLSQIKSEIERDFYIKSLSEKLAVKESSLRLDLNKVSSTAPKKPEIVSEDKLTKREKLERYLAFLLLNDQEHHLERSQLLLELAPRTAGLKQILQKIMEGKVFDLRVLSITMPGDLQELLGQLLLEKDLIKVADINFAEEWQKALHNLEQVISEEKIAKLTKEIEEIEAKKVKTSEDEVRLGTLLARVVRLKSK